MQSEIWEFVKSVSSYWGSFLTGTVIIALVWVYEHYKGRGISWQVAIVIIALAFLVATFFAWREQYRGWAVERTYRSRVADEFAKLRHTAQKRYYAWWEACRDPKASAEAKETAEEMRTKIIEKLRAEINEAEADYFNTPRMFEPFPANRSLIACPEAALINEFGYRVQRLGDIIQRLLQRPRQTS